MNLRTGLLPTYQATDPPLDRGKLLTAASSIAVILFLVPILEGSASGENKTWLFYICGGCLGVCGSLFVLVTYILYPGSRKHPSPLHFYRTICSFCIGMIALMYPYWMQGVCGHPSCKMDHKDDESIDMDRCQTASSLLQFFELASEGWFLCVSLDIRVSLSNPFSDYKRRMWRYHIISWSLGFVTAVIMAMSGADWFNYDESIKNDNGKDFSATPSAIYGFWYVTRDVDTTAFCWFKSDNDPNLLTANSWIWFLLYLPLLLVYIFSLVTIFSIYKKLRQGLSKTFHQRLGVLVRNSCNLLVYIFYWFFLGLLYMLSFMLAERAPNTAAWTWRFLLFGLAGKGFADLLVWLVMQDLEHATNDRTDASQLDEDLKPTVNKALQQEVLYYVTRGIRDCATQSANCPPGTPRQVYIMKRKEREAEDQITFMTFLTLVFSLAADDSLLSPPAEKQHRRVGSSATNRSHASSVSDGLALRFRQGIWKQVAGLFRHPVEETSHEHGSELHRFEATDAEQNIEIPDYDRMSMESIVGEFAQEDRRSSRVFPSGANSFTLARASILANYHLSRGSESTPFSCWGTDRTKNAASSGDTEGWANFIEYAPEAFRRVRLSMNLSDEAFVNSFKKTAKERITAGGASGAFFFFSGDERFIAKSCTGEEMLVLRRIADQYAIYITSNPESFIVRILGAYSITIYGNRFYFMVMQNLFYNQNKDVPSLRYDIKGSWVNRSGSVPRNGENVTCLHCNQKFKFYRDKKKRMRDRCKVTATGLHEPQTVFKDNDLNTKLRLGKELGPKILHQLNRDSDALRSFGVMDYSLLIGVCTREYNVDLSQGSRLELCSPSSSPASSLMEDPDQLEEAKAACTSEQSPPIGIGERFEVSRIVAPAYYYLGIIDILQEWNVDKALERLVKTRVLGQDPEGVSAIEPLTYQRRFSQKMVEIIEA